MNYGDGSHPGKEHSTMEITCILYNGIGYYLPQSETYPKMQQQKEKQKETMVNSEESREGRRGKPHARKEATNETSSVERDTKGEGSTLLHRDS